MKFSLVNPSNRQQALSGVPQASQEIPILGKSLAKSSARIFALSLILGGMLAGTAYANDPTLKGTLTIEISGNQDEISQPPLDGDLKITIPKRSRFAGLKIPKSVGGQPFRGQEFTVSIVPNGCVLDGGPTSGQALLRLSQKTQNQPITGSVFKTNVSGGQYECLFGGASQVMPYDPFDGNQQLSALGEVIILWTQAFSNSGIGTTQSVEAEVRQFFEIQDSSLVRSLRFRSVEYPSDQSPGCSADSKHLFCNRGGSAYGVFNADVWVKFKEQELE